MANLREVKVEGLTVKEFIEFVEKVREEFPVAFEMLKSKLDLQTKEQSLKLSKYKIMKWGNKGFVNFGGWHYLSEGDGHKEFDTYEDACAEIYEIIRYDGISLENLKIVREQKFNVKVGDFDGEQIEE